MERLIVNFFNQHIFNSRQETKMNKIDSKNVEDILALTPMQYGMLIYYLRNPESNVYFENLIVNLKGTIDPTVFRKTWEEIISNNEMLRTVFRWEGLENPVQVILKSCEGIIEIYKYSEEEGPLSLDEIDLTVDLLKTSFKVILYQFETDRYKLILCSHHILYDGWSTGILLNEFFDGYRSLMRNQKLIFPVMLVAKPKII
ncbi:condensation domain-containing protein [Paenibacillus sinensis]